MASGKKLGFFWGENSFCLAETENNLPVRLIHIPVVAGDDISLIASIQRTIRDEKISLPQVSLAISPNDVIIRSFSIPWMSSGEASGAIEFEAKKYIPFSLKDLSFSYHSVTITDNNVKMLRVTFVAVRRELLERYTYILEQSGLQVVFAEPASLSFVRALLLKKLIPADQKIALVQIEPSVARILFVHDGVVLFTREFQYNLQESDAVKDPQLIKARFLNEINNSLDFYTRQYSKQPVTQIAVVEPSADNSYSLWLKEELGGISIKSVDPALLVGDQVFGEEIDAISAFGVSLGVDSPKKILFNFTKALTAKEAAPVDQTSVYDITQYVKAIKVGIVCAVVVLLAVVLTQAKLMSLKGEVTALENEQAEFAASTEEDIKSQLKSVRERLSERKKIIYKSQHLELLSYLPESLGKDIWLRNISIRPSVGSAYNEISFTGFAYAEDPNQEIRTVNDMITRIKKNKRLAKYLKSVNLSNIEQQNVGGRAVVSFAVTCN